VTSSVIAVTPSQPSATKTPEALSNREKALAWALAIGGIVLVLGVLIWFGASTDDFSLKSKDVVTSEPVGGSGSKTTTENDYADTVVIFVLTIGAAFTLAGVFYGRLREITIGGATLKIGAPTEEQKQKVGEKAEEIVTEKAPPGQVEILKPVARAVAEDELEAHSLMTLSEPNENQLEAIAKAAATKVVEAANPTA
jgi:hypothetical protein